MMPLRDPFNRIPEHLLGEFIAGQITLTKSRVRLFCALSVGLYVLGTVMYYLLAFVPVPLKPEEMPLWGFFIFGAIAILVLIKKAKTIRMVRFHAYLLTLLFLAIITKLCVIYDITPDTVVTIFIFVLFLVAFTIPWTLKGIAFIALLDLAVYTGLFKHVHEVNAFPFDAPLYVDGVVFIFMAFSLCFVIRGKDIRRDVENFLFLKEIEEKNRQMRAELELATKVHKTLIPRSLSTDIADIAVMYLPMEYMGGDYAKFHFIDKKSLLFFICDITGHGVSAALLVNRIHTEFERIASEKREPAKLLRELNSFIIKDFEGTNMFLTAFCCLLDFKQMKIVYSNCGHPAQYLYRVSDAGIQRLASNAALLGISFGDTNINQKEIDFTPGNRLFLFTDGVIETKDAAGDEFGTERLEKFINENRQLDVNSFNQKLLEELSNFRKANFQDDIFIVNILTKEGRNDVV